MCNNIKDCKDESDEDVSFCKNWTCNPWQWKCRDNKTCIPIYQVLNGLNGKLNCPDGSDENPNITGTYPEGHQRCQNGQCMVESLWCDGRPNCRDKSDEGNV